MTEEIKKSYNPFKMWGSWVGLAIYIFLYLDAGYMSRINKLKPGFEEAGIFEKLLGRFMDIRGDAGMGIMLIAFYIAPIALFLIGWGIHLIFRKLKSK